MKYIPQELLEKIDYLKKNGNFEEALILVNQILQNEPTNTEALLLVTEIEYGLGNISKAEKPIDFMLHQNKGIDPTSNYVKGVLEMEKTHWHDAKQYFKKASELIKADNPEIIRCLGLCEYRSGNREMGINMLTKAFNINKFDIEIIYNLINIFFLETNYKKAQKLLDHYHNNINKIETFGANIKFYDDKIKKIENLIKSFISTSQDNLKGL